MELRVNPEDEIYEDVKYLIKEGSVFLSIAKLFTRDSYRRDGTYGKLYEMGFLASEGKFNLKFSHGKHNVLEDKTIVLHSRLKKPRRIFKIIK